MTLGLRGSEEVRTAPFPGSYSAAAVRTERAEEAGKDASIVRYRSRGVFVQRPRWPRTTNSGSPASITLMDHDGWKALGSHLKELKENLLSVLAYLPRGPRSSKDSPALALPGRLPLAWA